MLTPYSGKSSLLHTLLRLLDIKLGTIHINGFDLESLPRELVQSRVIAIPQDPFILSDTVRRNIDPFELVSDELIINALTKVHLWSTPQSRGGLDA